MSDTYYGFVTNIVTSKKESRKPIASKIKTELKKAPSLNVKFFIPA